jgi:hypothetical protein
VSIPDCVGLADPITITQAHHANLQGAMKTEGWLHALNFTRASSILVSLY